ncbi:protease Do-like protein 5, chloroplastic isoform X1 [Cinnamomum micranthum f. kanehirae]|uniref:Protease Do-like protein 5, chloroplastic isoform X1 n=1 Tax=Cinnamomum micranthum f. kanehirae TaxID=337451 RepID=A0A3S3N5P0_9MAGN|nr:protease Do-like protein 5, chloroplastic isoform X1 [Cinnamomum micranthum f. kanehirae]
MGSIPCLSSLLPTLHSPKFQPRDSKPDPSAAAAASSSYLLPNKIVVATITRRQSLFVASSLLAAAFLPPNPIYNTSFQIARAEGDESQQDEERIVHIFQEASPSVVSIKDLEILANPKKGNASNEDENARVEGTGSGFLWDNDGHIVTNYHVIAKLATDTTGSQRCKVFLMDIDGNTFSEEGNLIGFDPAYDLAVLKVNVNRNKLKPALIGTSHDLRVGQSCFAIGNPYGYEHTLTTGVVSGLGREIPSPNGRPIRGAIQTDASINAGNSGGPLIDSHGHVIGVNTATFTRKGTGISSGVNFAIPIDTVVKTIPYLIVYGTSVSNRMGKITENYGICGGKSGSMTQGKMEENDEF